MTAGPADPLAAALAGCPGAEHLCWMLAGWSKGAPPIEPEEVAAHTTAWFAPERGEPWPPWLMEMRTSPQAVTEVLGWRTSAFGDQVVTYRGDDGRLYDLVAKLEETSGIVVDFRTIRSIEGADLGAKAIADLSEGEWSALRACYSSAFRGGSRHYLDRRLEGLSTVGLAWKAGRLLGFSAVGMRQAEFPFVGQRSFLDCGLTCVDPRSTEGGVSNAVGTIAMQHTPSELPNEFSLLNFATPVMLRAAFRFGRSAWPGTTIAEVSAALASPTSTQRAVGQAIANLYQAASYDAEHWVMRSAESPGTSVTQPHDLESDYQRLFAHVDPAAGETLLGVFWWNDQPSQWWE